MFSGRSVDVKKDLIKMTVKRLSQRFELAINDIEITIVEIPATNWGLRGITGDEIK
jgi:phenylpyruvate tautomerase PptA (4-oxalocrotonate tautomerase family)